MSTTETYIGIGEKKLSSRVLKPPGGGHSNINIFSPPEEVRPHARPKYDQQNSSNLNFCMNTVDPNEKVARIAENNSVEVAPAASEPEVVMRDQNSAAADVPKQSSSSEQTDTKSNANLPQYHHHRSTALW
ncbi:hypothetical protein PVAND_009099 [Polypedilum vanderplanki]|uniref:Uncharacterized protein n=1 Tax=Polypedilum vanderplanki TaxID=319348 RepID=A0A9J6CCR0_POLVA|nr:hypothetical protein PVAND_009099 [Polypedilum vanderplanki]